MKMVVPGVVRAAVLGQRNTPSAFPACADQVSAPCYDHLSNLAAWDNNSAGLVRPDVSVFRQGSHMKRDELPPIVARLKADYPHVWEAYNQLGESVAKAGPLDARAERLSSSPSPLADDWKAPCVRTSPRTPSRNLGGGIGPRGSIGHHYNGLAKRHCWAVLDHRRNRKGHWPGLAWRCAVIGSKLQLDPTERFPKGVGGRSYWRGLVEVAGEEHRSTEVHLQSAAEVVGEHLHQFRPHVTRLACGIA